MNVEEIKERLQTELPELLKQDRSFRQWLEQLIRQTAVTPESFDARFERILQEFAADRAEQRQRWDEQDRKWEEQNRRNAEMLEEIRISRTRQEQAIGALGARWGSASEYSFREALKGILEKSFGVQVLNVTEFDDEGIVFGVPDQVEIDIIVKNGELILCELKSSTSKSDMYTCDRKARYYEQRHQRKITRKIVISPMVLKPTREVADKLGIEVFGFAEDTTGL